jgi:spore coat protein CotH
MMRVVLTSLVTIGIGLVTACSGDGASTHGSGVAPGPGRPTEASDSSAAGSPPVAASVPGSGGGDSSAALYDPDTIPEFELGLDAAAIAVLSNPDPATQKQWVHGTFKHGTTTFADVGVRRKGSSSFRWLPRKVSLKVSFNKWVKHRRYLGLTDITLDNMVDDPTFVAERLSYYVFRENGVLAPRANSAHVKINGEDFGLYANVETPDADLLARLFGKDAGTLYEADFGSEWTPGFEKGFTVHVGADTKTDLTALFKVVQTATSNSLLADVGTKLDTNQWLKLAATEAMIGQQDGYAFGRVGSHNYFMTANKAGMFSLLPWSTDVTFTDNPSVLDASVPRPADPNQGGDTLLVRCKAAAACWQTYKEAVSATVARFESLELSKVAAKWHAQIDALARTDPKCETSIPGYESATTALNAWIAARPTVMRGQLGL